MTHLHEIKGGENVKDSSEVSEQWRQMIQVLDASSLASDLENTRSFIATLKKHHSTQDDSLFYFILLNGALFLTLVLWWSRAKVNLHYQ